MLSFSPSQKKSTSNLKSKSESSPTSKSSTYHELQSTHDMSSNQTQQNILDLQQTLGNQEVQRMIKSGIIQPKLKISHSNDPYEREADRVADQIMRMSSVSDSIESGIQEPHNKIQRKKCSGCEMKNDDKELKINRKSTSSSSLETSDEVANQINNTSGGKTLDDNTKSFMESRFNHDFSNVKIHDDSKSQQLSRSVNARAFTTGNDIFWGENESVSDKKLMAHELTHVVQQQGSTLFSDHYIQRKKKFATSQEEILNQILKTPKDDSWKQHMISIFKNANSNEIQTIYDRLVRKKKDPLYIRFHNDLDSNLKTQLLNILRKKLSISRESEESEKELEEKPEGETSSPDSSEEKYEPPAPEEPHPVCEEGPYAVCEEPYEEYEPPAPEDSFSADELANAGLLSLGYLLQNEIANEAVTLRTLYNRGAAVIIKEESRLLSLMKQGKISESEVARRLSNMRHKLAVNVRRTGSKLLKQGAELFDKVRGNTVRPTYDALRASGKTNAQIIKSASKTNNFINKLPSRMKWTGKGLWFVSGALSVYIVLDAPEGERAEAAQDEIEGIIGGIGGTALATSACVGLGIATAGAGLIVCGLIGGLVGSQVARESNLLQLLDIAPHERQGLAGTYYRIEGTWDETDLFVISIPHRTVSAAENIQVVANGRVSGSQMSGRGHYRSLEVIPANQAAVNLFENKNARWVPERLLTGVTPRELDTT